MKKLMIADDESIVRQGIMRGIDWAGNGYEFVAEAENGEDALDKIRAFRPDVLLLDIRMPLMGGLELMKETAGQFPDMGIIILSSYAEFEYAREAMKYGADEYLLKLSSKPRDILKCVDTVYEKKKKEKRARMTMPHYKAEYLTDFAAETNFYLVSIKLFHTNGKSYDITGQLEELIYENTPGLFGDSRHLVLYRSQNRYLAAAAVPDIEASTKKLRAVLETGGLLICRFGISGLCPRGSGIREIEETLLQAETACDATFFSGKDIVRYFGIRPVKPESEVDLTLIGTCTEEELPKKIESIMAKIFQKNRCCKKEEFDELLVNFLFTAANRLKLCGKEIPENLKSVEAIFQYIQEFYSSRALQEALEKLFEVLFAVSGESYVGIRTVVYRIRTAVDKNYAMDLTLGIFAEMMNISYSYLSVIFKNETGYSFKEYLNMVRVQKAKELFQSTNCSVGEAAEKTGYSNQFYFSKTFKRYTGFMPIEYKNGHMGDELERDLAVKLS